MGKVFGKFVKEEKKILREMFRSSKAIICISSTAVFNYF